MKNKYKIKNQLCPRENSDAVCKSEVDILFNDSSIIKNTTHIDLNDKNITILPTHDLYKLINYLELTLI